MKFTVSHPGDRATGIPAETVVVDVNVEVYSAEIRGDYISQINDALLNCFGQLWMTPLVRVSHSPIEKIPFNVIEPLQHGDQHQTGQALTSCQDVQFEEEAATTGSA